MANEITEGENLANGTLALAVELLMVTRLTWLQGVEAWYLLRKANFCLSMITGPNESACPER